MNKIYDPENEQDLQELTSLIVLCPDLPVEMISKRKDYTVDLWTDRDYPYDSDGEWRGFSTDLFYRIKKEVK